MSLRPINPVPCDPTYATCSDKSLEKACCRLKFQELAYGLRRFGSTPVTAQGLFAPAGVALSGESQRICVLVGNTGPAIFQLTPLGYCTLAVVMSPGPGAPFSNAPVGMAFTPSAEMPC